MTQLRATLATGSQTLSSVAHEVSARANRNASLNTYTHFDPANLALQAKALQHSAARPPLYGVPISIKDCFDLAGAPTTCGSRFYAQRGVVAEDSSMAASLRAAGAFITGKTHLHPLAYGITGENPEYGNCLQPRDPTLLTGGSSSGAAASVQEGSAVAAIGTDTGGSIRVPAALCGLVGYRASHSLPSLWWPGAWRGAAHLAPSFDTLGFLLRDPRDAAPLAQALFRVPAGTSPSHPQIACVAKPSLADCDDDDDVWLAFQAWKHQLAATGAHLIDYDPSNPTGANDPEALDWQAAVAIFSGIQAHEAALLHAGHYDHFEPAIRDRLRWGASLRQAELAGLRRRLASFRAALGHLFSRFDLLLMPCAPVSRLPAGADHASARPRILRYTAPFSLAGLPVLSLPGEIIGAPRGTGIQLAAAPSADPMLLAYAGAIGDRLASRT